MVEAVAIAAVEAAEEHDQTTVEAAVLQAVQLLWRRPCEMRQLHEVVAEAEHEAHKATHREAKELITEVNEAAVVKDDAVRMVVAHESMDKMDGTVSISMTSLRTTRTWMTC
jgi:hypothetical protein